MTVMWLCKTTGRSAIGCFGELHGTFEDIDVALCLSVGLSVPCPTPPAADKSLSLMHKSSPSTGEAVYETGSQ